MTVPKLSVDRTSLTRPRVQDFLFSLIRLFKGVCKGKHTCLVNNITKLHRKEVFTLNPVMKFVFENIFSFKYYLLNNFYRMRPSKPIRLTRYKPKLELFLSRTAMLKLSLHFGENWLTSKLQLETLW